LNGGDNWDVELHWSEIIEIWGDLKEIESDLKLAWYDQFSDLVIWIDKFRQVKAEQVEAIATKYQKFVTRYSGLKETEVDEVLDKLLESTRLKVTHAPQNDTLGLAMTAFA